MGTEITGNSYYIINKVFYDPVVSTASLQGQYLQYTTTSMQSQKTIDEMMKEIQTITTIDSTIESILIEREDFITAIYRAIESCNSFLTEFLHSVAENRFGTQTEPLYSIEIWDDPDYEEDLKPILVIMIPDMIEYDLFAIWKEIDRLIYEQISYHLLGTSIRGV
ncbi:MAG: hypothetical protein ACTSRU_04905 [Candidatus Hodarchaeales archaeon]